MPPQLQDWHDRCAAQADEARALAAPLSDAAFNAPGPGGGWSVGQCFGHLLEAGEPLVRGLEASLARAQKAGRTGTPPYAFGWVGQLMIDAVTPGGRRLPAPPSYRPGAHYPPGATLARFEALMARLSAFVEAAAPYNLGRMRAPSPALPGLYLRASAWMEGTLRHHARHLAQARRAAAHATAAA